MYKGSLDSEEGRGRLPGVRGERTWLIKTNSLLCLGYIVQTILGMIYFGQIKKQLASPANDL